MISNGFFSFKYEFNNGINVGWLIFSLKLAKELFAFWIYYGVPPSLLLFVGTFNPLCFMLLKKSCLHLFSIFRLYTSKIKFIFHNDNFISSNQSSLMCIHKIIMLLIKQPRWEQIVKPELLNSFVSKKNIQNIRFIVRSYLFVSWMSVHWGILNS